MSRITLFILLWVLSIAPLQAAVKREALHLDELLSDKEQDAMGIKNLRPEQRQKLEDWIMRYAEKKVEEAVANKTADDEDTVLYRIRSNQNGETISLDDGSVWQIGSFDKVKVRFWLPQQRIQIIRNRSSLRPYRLINMNTGESANASLIKPSMPDDEEPKEPGKSSTIKKQIKANEMEQE